MTHNKGFTHQRSPLYLLVVYKKNIEAEPSFVNYTILCKTSRRYLLLLYYCFLIIIFSTNNDGNTITCKDYSL